MSSKIISSIRPFFVFTRARTGRVSTGKRKQILSDALMYTRGNPSKDVEPHSVGHLRFFRFAKRIEKKKADITGCRVSYVNRDRTDNAIISIVRELHTETGPSDIKYFADVIDA